MSNDDLKQIEKLMSDLLSHDNKIRGDAEKQLDQLKTNPSALVFYLAKLVLESENNGVKTLSSVLLRKFITIKEEEDVNPIWEGLDEKFKESIKNDLLKAILKEKNKVNKIKICDTMVSVAENVFEKKENWPDFFNFISEGISLSTDDKENSANIETVLFLLSQIFGLIYENIENKLDTFIAYFKNFFGTDNYDLKTRTSQVIGEILTVVNKKESKKFKEFIPLVLEHTYKCLIDEKQENNLKLCLMTISDLACSEPNILRKWFNDIYILLGKVIEKKDLDGTNLRDLSFEIIVTLVESYPKHFKTDKEKLKVFIQSLFKYSLEMDMELNDEWTSPKTLSFIEEDVVPEGNLQLALGMIERLYDVIDAKLILENLVSIVQDLLGNDSNEWKFKYTAFMTLCTMCDEIDDMAEVKNIFPTVFSNLKNDHPKIRFACMQVIEASIDQFNPLFHQSYHKELVPCFLEGIKDEKVLRCQLQTSETLNAFIDNCPEEILKEHTKSILDALFPVLLEKSTFVSLKENILNVLSSLVNNLGDDDFKPYAETSLDLLIKSFSALLSENKDKSIYGSLLELITTVGPCCDDIYKKYISDLTSAMISLQNTIPYSTDPLFDYLSSGWEKLIPYIKLYHTELVSSIIESTLKLVSNVPTMKISSEPENTFNIHDLLRDDTQDPKIIKQKLTVNTSETQDYAGSLSLLSTIIDAFGEQYVSYVDHTEKIIIPLLSFQINDDIRVEAANVIPFLLEVIKNKLTKEDKMSLFHDKCKHYLSELIAVLEKEDYNVAVCCQLDAVGSLIEKAGLFLQGKEIENLFVKLLEIFDKVEIHRLELIKKRQDTADNFEKDRKEGNDRINSDDEGCEDDEEAILKEMKKEVEEIEDILVSIADIMGSMFKTHKEHTLEIVKQLINSLLPKYFTKGATSFEIKMGLYIVDDMIEFLGQDLLSNIWKDLVQICLNYVDDKDAPLRQASVYGLGEFAVNTTSDFSGYAEYVIEGIEKALRFGDDGQIITQWKTARDNAVSALGKVIKYQHKNVDIQKLVDLWVSYLPINEDDVEGKRQHKIFVELLINNTDLVIGDNKGNLNKVLRILAKIVDTKFVDDSTNSEIKNLISKLKTNDQFAPFIRQSINEANKELAEKMMELFK